MPGPGIIAMKSFAQLRITKGASEVECTAAAASTKSFVP